MNIDLKCSCGAEIKVSDLAEEDFYNRVPINRWFEIHKKCNKHQSPNPAVIIPSITVPMTTPSPPQCEFTTTIPATCSDGGHQ